MAGTKLHLVADTPSTARDDAPDGWTTLRVHFDDEEEARFVVLGFGPRVEVIEPASLRDRVWADVTSVMERMNRQLSLDSTGRASASTKG
jgi:predicted DNA-binding transcriptional regulator YafY